MGIQDEVEVLRQIPLFAKIDPAKLKLLAFASERLTFSPGEELFHQGDFGDSAYIILKGDADIIIDTPGGPITVATAKRNEIIGEIAILCDVPRTATVKAVGALTTLKVTKDLFFRMVTDFPEMAVEIMRELAQRLEHANTRLREVVASNA
jgi:CRP/FNR family cyclic AMP-dependent transcriptional regulator